MYTKCQSPARVNLPWAWPAWDVLPEWSSHSLGACEAAETFSLGRTMWMMLQEMLQEDLEDLDSKDIAVEMRTLVLYLVTGKLA